MDRQFVGWVSLLLFMAALVILAILLLLVLTPDIQRYIPFSAQSIIITAGMMGLVAAVLGFYAFRTQQGRVGAIGGLTIAVAVAILLSFTTITTVERSEGHAPLPVAIATVR